MLMHLPSQHTCMISVLPHLLFQAIVVEMSTFHNYVATLSSLLLNPKAIEQQVYDKAF